MPMLGPDARGAIEPGLLGDPRVRQFWDEERVVGRWLADTAVGDIGSTSVVWDAYYVFGPAAAWNTVPGPVVSSGEPVISSTGTLEQALAPLLR